eukprot:SAG11_NODE_19876_length_457_cov_0.865922_1_plen_42_part_01
MKKDRFFFRFGLATMCLFFRRLYGLIFGTYVWVVQVPEALKP